MLWFIVFLGILNLTNCQFRSPCPEVFTYETENNGRDTWYGVVSYRSDETLNGIWLRIILDRPAELLGNWFGEAVIKDDHKEFVIKNPNYKLRADDILNVRFFIKYNVNQPIPRINNIRLNGKDICGSTITTTTHEPVLHISKPEKGNNGASGGNGAGGGNSGSRLPPITVKPIGGSETPSSTFNNEGSSANDNNYRPNNFNSERPSASLNPSNTYPTTGNQNSQPSGSQSVNNFNSQSPNRGENEQYGGNSQSQGNHLSASAEEGNNAQSSDYFPGDFALITRPTVSRPPTQPPTPPSRVKPSCGTVATQPSPLVSYGSKTIKGQWPWHAALYHSEGGIHLMYTCGATLISEYHVLTAAHCVAKPRSNTAISSQSILVYFGKHNLNKFGAEVQDREVSQIIIHPQYNHSVFFNDIAILKLANPVDLNNYVRPVCLWEGSTDVNLITDKLGTVVGWGFDENKQLSMTLMKAEMPVVSTVNCIYSNREFFSQFTFEKNYCAGFRNGTSVCNGDSGGGMVFPRSTTNNQRNSNPVWQIRGIVSVGVALQGKGVCDPSHYIVFTDVAKYTDWIKAVMKQQQ